jgi:putative transposase
MTSETNENIKHGVGKHGVGYNQHHLEWCPKYRHDAMQTVQIAEEMRQILLQIASDKGIIVHKLVVDSDHVHLFVSLPLWMSVSLALQYLKGISAYKIFRSHPEFREELFRKGSFWSPGHFSRSVSNVTAATVERYIDKHEYPKYVYGGEGHQTRMGRFM